MNLKTLIPDNLAEAIGTIIIGIISWWLGRKNGNKERRKSRRPIDHTDRRNY